MSRDQCEMQRMGAYQNPDPDAQPADLPCEIVTALVNELKSWVGEEWPSNMRGFSQCVGCSGFETQGHRPSCRVDKAYRLMEVAI